jgi:hypothetical protein
MVGERGLEPPHLSILAPKTSVSTIRRLADHHGNIVNGAAERT